MPRRKAVKEIVTAITQKSPQLESIAVPGINASESISRQGGKSPKKSLGAKAAKAEKTRTGTKPKSKSWGGSQRDARGRFVPKGTAVAARRRGFASGIKASKATSPAALEALLGARSPAAAEGASSWWSKLKGGTKGLPWGKIAKFGGPVLFGGMLAADVASSRSKEAQIRAMKAPTAEDYLREMEQDQMLAAREARLARQDPEAYQILQGILSGESAPQLATGQFVIGQPPQGQPTADPAVMRELMAALA